jgi:hypothetical protein
LEQVELEFQLVEVVMVIPLLLQHQVHLVLHQQQEVVVEQDFLQDLLHMILLLVKLWEDLVDLEVVLEVVDLLITQLLLVQLLEQEDQEILLL